mmetsp:Transcript_33449/g.81056  ORF Transcript_33449/g.81056 Transcript_33449/m.81056 type:complete len:297 (+) Transcript_33449:129-1019(+)
MNPVEFLLPPPRLLVDQFLHVLAPFRLERVGHPLIILCVEFEGPDSRLYVCQFLVWEELNLNLLTRVVQPQRDETYAFVQHTNHKFTRKVRPMCLTHVVVCEIFCLESAHRLLVALRPLPQSLRVWGLHFKDPVGSDDVKKVVVSVVKVKLAAVDSKVAVGNRCRVLTVVKTDLVQHKVLFLPYLHLVLLQAPTLLDYPELGVWQLLLQVFGSGGWGVLRPNQKLDGVSGGASLVSPMGEEEAQAVLPSVVKIRRLCPIGATHELVVNHRRDQLVQSTLQPSLGSVVSALAKVKRV